MAEDLTFRSNYIEGVNKFQNVRGRAFWEEILSLITRHQNELMNFDEVRSRLHLHEEHYLGIQDVPLDQIVGSVGRYRDFTATFLPKNNKMKERWSRVYAVAHSLEGPPPIELYKVGDAYFVRDGNHRVSVARQVGAQSIEAHVTELPTSVPLRPGMSNQELESAEAYANFLEKTGLGRAVPDHESIELTIPARYHELMGHIFMYQRILEQMEGNPVTTESVTAHWYDNVYLPAVKLIRKYNVMELSKDNKTNRTEGDLYLWLMDHLMDLRRQYGDSSPTRKFSDAIKDYLSEEHVDVPEELASEDDQSVILSRTQAITSQKQDEAKDE
jgi:regulator of sigma D